MSPSDLLVPALRTRQADARHIYQFAVDGKALPRFAAVSRVRRDDQLRVAGYQRPEMLAHIKAIRAYIEAPGALMPNAIVVAFDARVRFEPAGPPDGPTTVGRLRIPLDLDPAPGWLVDGQQRCAAVRDADVASFPVPAVAFITDDVREQRSQFILVNNVKPLPKGLIHELLPGTGGLLPVTLRRKRTPAMLLDALNLRPGSPLQGRIRTPTVPEGIIRDNSMLRCLERSLGDGALYEFRDPQTGAGDLEAMHAVLCAYWSAVRDTFPDAWELPPRRSRLSHGAGVLAMGFLLDEMHARLGGGTPSREQFLAELAHVAPVCAWTSGTWDFGAGRRRAWNELQNTSVDCALLGDHLVRAYREATGRRHAA